jgi:transcriptional regulator with XRE-family HTH domain
LPKEDAESFNFGEFVKRKRKEMNLTHKELSAASSVSQSYISMLENGRTPYPSLKIIKRLSPHLNISENEMAIILGVLEKNEDESHEISDKRSESIFNKEFNFGDYLKSKRKENDFTHKSLSAASGVSQSYISMLENGKTPFPSAKILKKLAPHLKISDQELVELLGLIEESEFKGYEKEKKKESKENLFVFDLEGLSQEDINKIKEQIELYKLRAKLQDSDRDK